MSSKQDRKRRSIPKIEFAFWQYLCYLRDRAQRKQIKTWNNFKIQTKRWQEIAIASGDSKYIYTKLYDKIKNFDCAQRFAHLPCHTNLRTKVVIYAERYAETEGDSEIDMDISLNESTHRKYRSNENRLIRKSCVLFVKKNGSLIISHLTRWVRKVHSGTRWKSN